MHTIFAQSSRPGKAGVSVFRLSGSKSLFVLKKLLASKESITPRKMYYRKIYTLEDHRLIDQVMVVYFQTPNSFTGEEVVEIYTHGSIAIAKILTATVLSISDVRMAEPGEFTRRAFINNKFDLTEAEGLIDLINAETIWQHKQAINQMCGALSTVYESWRNRLLTMISMLEAYIDFPDEEIPMTIIDQVLNNVKALIEEIKLHLSDNRRGELLRHGIKLAILGPTNAGKSSLINYLMKRDVSIVSSIAGTTRDVIETHLDIGNYPIILQDTAGIRSNSTDIIEQEGIKRSLSVARDADIKIIMFDAQNLLPMNNSEWIKMIDNNTIVVINKIDLYNQSLRLPVLDYPNQPILVSVQSNFGVQELLSAIAIQAGNLAGLTDTPHLTQVRHRCHLEKALQYLSDINVHDDIVLVTEDIRMTIQTLSHLTGKITVDEILGEIFSSFCIGK